jgi:hypothetical protein
MLVQDIKLQLVRPPVPVRGATAGDLLARSARDWAPVLVIHKIASCPLPTYSLCCYEYSLRVEFIDCINRSLWELELGTLNLSVPFECTALEKLPETRTFIS